MKNFFKNNRSHIISLFAKTHQEMKKMLYSHQYQKSVRILAFTNFPTLKTSSNDLTEEFMLKTLEELNSENSLLKSSLRQSSEKIQQIFSFRSEFLSSLKFT
jgi:poly-beta-hydroxyalkanoate depolymerase